MTYDLTDRQFVAFGGQPAGGSSSSTRYSNDTWTYRDGTWSAVCPTADSLGVQCGPTPAGRAGPLMTYDGADRVVLMTGGLGRNPAPNGSSTQGWQDLWQFTGGTWTNLTTSVPPMGLWDGTLCYDPVDGYVLAFTDTGGTWSFVGGRWAQLSPLDNPQPRSHAASFFDVAQGAVIMYGGVSTAGRALNDTWAFSGGTWSKVLVPLSPGERRSTASFPVLPEPIPAAYDSVRGVGVLIDPYGDGGNATWYFTNGVWQNATASLHDVPPTSLGASFAFNPMDGFGLFVDFAAIGAAGLTWAFSDPLQVSLGLTSTTIDASQSATWSASLSAGLPPFVTAILRSSASCTLLGTASPMPVLSCAGGSAGAYSVVVGFSDSLGRSANATYRLSVNADPAITINSARPDPSSAGVPVQFFATASSGTPPYSGFSWSFDDGATSTAFSPTHTFSTSGLHSASVQVSDSLGFPVSAQLEVLVHAGPSASVAANITTTDPGLPIEFSSSVAGGTGTLSCSWNFADGSTIAACTALHAFQSPGRYIVRFWTNDSLGAGGFDNVTVRVVRGLAAEVQLATPSPIAGGPVALALSGSGGLEPYTVQWWFGDGGVASGLNVSHTYGLPGTYAAAAEVTDSVGGRIWAQTMVTVAANQSSGSTPGSGTGSGIPPSGSMTVPLPRSTTAPSGSVPWLAFEIVGAFALALLWMRRELRLPAARRLRVGWIRRLLQSIRP
jgi:hypothetical protein